MKYKGYALDVCQYIGAEGDGTTDDTTAIQAAIDATPQFGTVYFPAGRYRITRALKITKPLNICGDGRGSVIENCGTENAFTVDGTGIPLRGIQGMRMENLTIAGAEGSADAVHLSWVFRSHFENIIVPRTGAAGFHLYGAILNNFINCQVTTNIPGIGYQEGAAGGAGPVNGIKGELQTLTDEWGEHNMYTAANYFYGCVIEGVSGAGVDLGSSSAGNTFLGGCIEGNGIGVRLGAYCRNNYFVGTYFEENGINFAGEGYPYQNAMIGVHTSIDGAVDTVNYLHKLSLEGAGSLHGNSDGSIELRTPSGVVYVNDDYCGASVLRVGSISAAASSALELRGGGKTQQVIARSDGSLYVSAEGNLCESFAGNFYRLQGPTGTCAMVYADGNWTLHGSQYYPAGSGPVVTTPDGQRHYRIGVDNAGNLTATQLP